ncbi:hypothetical protein PEBR_33376 [Penicillium brasilianum]|uniref:Uncharacterized protein n=1 Tax=Penicillium brasilianum TaxID=104259 RepID=A0A1S9RDY1_PENBI|nr:hypothetical protein PEBR_33376 [Penicillium brasilianum]
MEEHPEHWRNTLMGWDFWQDAKQYEDKISQELDIALDLDLPKRFPFNLVPEESPTKRQRRLRPTSAVHDHPPRARLMASSLNPFTSRGSAPMTLSALRSGRSSPFKQPDQPPGVIVKTREVSPSPAPPISRQPTPTADDFATAESPFIGFRGGLTWSDLPRTKKTLGLDLFGPSGEETNGPSCLNIIELEPLCQFRCLRSPRITGMLQSYQAFIWQAAWLNLDLEELSLEMGLEPEIDSTVHRAQWKAIKDGWEMDKKHYAEPVYHGNLGDGALHPDIGCGEYLDKHSIEKAKILAMARGRTSQRMSVKHLTLSGFVDRTNVETGLRPRQRLKSIKFQGQCLDAGFWPPQSMEHVIVRYPRRIELEPVAVEMVSSDPQKELKVVDIQGGLDVGCGSELSSGI